MTALNDIDMNGIEGQMGGSALVPEGIYRCVLVEGNRKRTSKGTGEYLELKFGIQGGEFDGCNIKYRLNLWNPNATATKIAKQEYKHLLDAINLDPRQVADVSQMFNIPLDVKVKVRNYKDPQTSEDKQSNEIVDFIQVGVANNQQQAQPQQQYQNQNQNMQQQGQAERPY